MYPLVTIGMSLTTRKIARKLRGTQAVTPVAKKNPPLKGASYLNLSVFKGLRVITLDNSVEFISFFSSGPELSRPDNSCGARCALPSLASVRLPKRNEATGRCRHAASLQNRIADPCIIPGRTAMREVRRSYCPSPSLFTTNTLRVAVTLVWSFTGTSYMPSCLIGSESWIVRRSTSCP